MTNPIFCGDIRFEWRFSHIVRLAAGNTENIDNIIEIMNNTNDSSYDLYRWFNEGRYPISFDTIDLNGRKDHRLQITGVDVL
jgi:hypothetical protein